MRSNVLRIMTWWFNLCLIVLIKLVSGSGIDEYPIGNIYGRARIKPNSRRVADLNEYVLYSTSVESQGYDTMPQHHADHYGGWCPECTNSNRQIYESRGYQPQSYISRDREFNIPEEENVYILNHYENDRQSRPRYARLLPTEYYEIPEGGGNYMVRDDDANHMDPEMGVFYGRQSDHSYISSLSDYEKDIYPAHYGTETEVVRHTRHPYINARNFQYHPSFGLHNPNMRHFLPTEPKSYECLTGVNAGHQYAGMQSASGNKIGQNYVQRFSNPNVKLSGIKSYKGYENLNNPRNFGKNLLRNVNFNEIGKFTYKHVKENHDKDANTYKNVEEKSERLSNLNGQISHAERRYAEEHVHEENEEKFFHEQSETITKQQLTRGIEIGDNINLSKNTEYLNANKDIMEISSNEIANKQNSEISSGQQFHSTEKHCSESKVKQSIETASFEKEQTSQSSEHGNAHFSSERHASESRQYDEVSKSSSENEVRFSSEKHFSEVGSNELSSLEKHSISQEIVQSSEKHISVSKEVDITREYSSEFGEEKYKSEKYVSASEEIDSSIEKHSQEVEEQIYSSETGGASSNIKIYNSKEFDYSSEKHSSESKEIIYKSSEDRRESHKSVEIHSSKSQEEHQSYEKQSSEYALHHKAEQQLEKSKEEEYSSNIHTSKSDEARISVEKHYFESKELGYASSQKYFGSQENHFSSEKHTGSKEIHLSSEKHFESKEKQFSLEKIFSGSHESSTLEKSFGSKEVVYGHSYENRDSAIHIGGSKEISFQSKPHLPLPKEKLHSCEDDVIKVANDYLSHIHSPVKSQVIQISEVPHTSHSSSQTKDCHKKVHIIETKNYNHNSYKQLPEEGVIFNPDSRSYEDVETENIKNEKITEHRNLYNRIPCRSSICNAAFYDISSLQLTDKNSERDESELSAEIYPYTHNNDYNVGLNSLHHVLQQYDNKIPTQYRKKVCKKRKKYCPSSNRNKCDCVKSYQQLEPTWPERNLHFENKLKLKNKRKFLRHTSETINPENRKNNEQLESAEIDKRLSNLAVIYSSFV